jgi:hypothetical protein
MAIKLKSDTDEAIQFKEFVESTATQVLAWPAWMRGDYSQLAEAKLDVIPKNGPDSERVTC